MRKFAVIGSGMQGIASAFDIAKFGNPSEIIICDYNYKLAVTGAKRINSLMKNEIVKAKQIDATNPDELREIIKNSVSVIAATPYYLNPQIAEICVEMGAHYSDFGGNMDVSAKVLEMSALAKSKGVSLIPDCGIAPGTVNIFARKLIDEDPSIHSIHIFCGGIPVKEELPFGYKLVFSPEGLINEYLGESIILENSKISRRKTLTEVEDIEFKKLNKVFDAFHTSGGASTAPFTFKDNLKNYTYKTCRYKGHISFIQGLEELGYFSSEKIKIGDEEIIPRKVTEKLFTEKFDFPKEKDMLIIKVISKSENGTKEYETVDLEDEYGFTAMERTTGYSGALVAIMQADGEIEPGADVVEKIIPAAKYIKELEKRNIVFEKMN